MSAPVRIGIDARELLGNTTGVGRYLGELVRRWTVRDDAASRRLVLYSPEPLQISFSEEAAENRVVPGGRGTWWEQTALAQAVRRDRPDVFFAPAYTAPLGLRMPLAVTIHDISFIARPEWFRPRERWRRRLLTARAARRAAVIFTDSEFSRSELHSRLGVPPARVRVITPGVTSPAPPTRPASSPPRSPMVLFVGTLFNRRRLPDLIAAFARATATVPDARLVLVGADRTWPPQDLRREAASRGIEEKVQLLDYVNIESLSELYARASVFVFLSEYEGFGLTPLEALAAGVPIVVLDTAVAREVYGAAAEFVPCADLDATAAAIARFINSRAAAHDQLAHAPAVLARYSWERAAEETLRQIEAVAR